MEDLQNDLSDGDLITGSENSIFSLGKLFLPLTTILLSTVSDLLDDVNIVFSIVIKLTTILTFLIYLLINLDTIKKQIKKWLKK